MPKYHGMIGFAETVMTNPDVYVEQIQEYEYCGDLIRNTKRTDGDSMVNQGITIGNDISIVADPYAQENFHKMRYITFMGTRWAINSIEVKHPRLIISTGGVWNGQTGATGPDSPSDPRHESCLFSTT